MSKRNWFTATALGLALSTGALAQGKPESAGQQGETATARQQDTTPEPSYADRLLTAIERIEPAIRELIAEEDKVAAEAESRRNHADLEAQKSMALWAFWMFIASAVSVVLTGVGVVLIWRTLHHTRRAADYTSGMLKEAKRTTSVALIGAKEARRASEEAARSNDIMLASHTAQSRPWMVLKIQLFDDAFVQDNGRVQFPVRVELRNIGKLPAENLHIGVSSARYGVGETLDDFVKLHARDGAQWSEKVLLPDETDFEFWPQVPVYDPPKEGEAFRVTLFSIYVGAFYKTPAMDGYRITATEYLASVRMDREDGRFRLVNNRPGFTRQKGYVA